MGKIYGFSSFLKAEINSDMPPFIGDLGCDNPVRGDAVEMPKPYVLRIKSKEFGLEDIPVNGFLNLAPGSLPSKYFKGFLKKELIPIETIYYWQGPFSRTHQFSRSRPLHASNEFALDLEIEFGFSGLDIDAAIDASKGVDKEGVLVTYTSLLTIACNAVVNGVAIMAKKDPVHVRLNGNQISLDLKPEDRKPGSQFFQSLNGAISAWLTINKPVKKHGFVGLYVKAIG